MTGTLLAHYRIGEKLGEGGMGVVYKAHDTRLGRDVAIKVLPPSLAADPERMARFEREARALASLNHPNIAAIYGIEEQGGGRFLVLEYVPGEILRGPLAPEDARHIARQIVEGLEAAHEKGIIHRDLKPANIKVTPDGVVKLLDFGLAKALEGESRDADPAESPTLTAAATGLGVILGTAAYMSPEQARGGSVDRRADVWGFGAVLYELLAGRSAFARPTTTDTLAAVVKEEPDWGRLPTRLPGRMRYLLERCLHKDRKQRLQAIGEARILLDETNAAKPEPTRRLALLAVTGGLVVLAALAGLLAWRTLRPAPQTAWSGIWFGGPRWAIGPRISPDGRTLAFQAVVGLQNQVAVMRPETGNWTVLTRDTSRGYIAEISWARDGSRLYFDRILGSPAGVYTVPVLGGEEKLVLENAAVPQALPDGSLIVVRINARRLRQPHRFWPDTGRLQPLPAQLARGFGATSIRVFPDGKEAVYFGTPVEGDKELGPAELYALDLASGRSRPLAPGVTFPGGETTPFPLAVTPDGRSVLVQQRAGNLYRIDAIPRHGRGSPEPLLSMGHPFWNLDVGPDSSVYGDQLFLPTGALRFPITGGSPESLVRTTTPDSSTVVEHPAGGVLLPVLLAGKTRLVVVKPGAEPTPVIDTREEIGVGFTLIGDRQVAFLLAPLQRPEIAIASLDDGRILRRLKGPTSRVEDLVAAPDGQLIYVSDKTVWALPVEGGPPRRISAGDHVAVDHRARELIVKLNEHGRGRLVRVPLGGGPMRDLPFSGPAALTENLLSSNAVGPDGRILLQVVTPGSWFFRAAVLDPRTGKLSVIPLDYLGDLASPGWTRDGRVLAIGIDYYTSIWRFRPEGRAR